jgi:hypothetical protein
VLLLLPSVLLPVEMLLAALLGAALMLSWLLLHVLQLLQCLNAYTPLLLLALQQHCCW